MFNLNIQSITTINERLVVVHFADGRAQDFWYIAHLAGFWF